MRDLLAPGSRASTVWSVSTGADQEPTPAEPCEPAAVDPSFMPGIGRARPLVFAGVWLVYLVSPLTDVLHSDGPWRVVGVLALLGFSALFLVGTLLIRDVRRGEPAAQTRSGCCSGPWSSCSRSPPRPAARTWWAARSTSPCSR